MCKISKLIESNMRSDENCQISAPFELCKMKFNSIPLHHCIISISLTLDQLRRNENYKKIHASHNIVGTPESVVLTHESRTLYIITFDNTLHVDDLLLLTHDMLSIQKKTTQALAFPSHNDFHQIHVA